MARSNSNWGAPRIHAELLNLPRLKNVIRFAGAQPQAAEEAPSGPSTSKREYIRRSVPTGGTLQGKQHVAQQAWLDSGQNNPEQMQQAMSV